MILSTAKRDRIWYAAVTDQEGRLVACSFADEEKAAEKSAIKSLPKTLRHDIMRSRGSRQVIDVLHRIYSGKDSNRQPDIVIIRPSKFLKRVYERTRRIPKGKVTTYARLARFAGSKRLSRAVGNAMARNPLPLIIPCHRVVPSTLGVGNYGGGGTEKGRGGRVKRALLLREGVQFEGERILPNCVWDPS